MRDGCRTRQPSRQRPAYAGRKKPEATAIRKFIGEYWIIYYLSYPIFAAILLWLHRYSPRWPEDWVSLLADILGVALAGAIAFTIFSEVLGKMVLLIPKAVQKIRDEGEAEGRAKGHAEGRQEGRAEEQEAQLARREEALRRFGVEENGVRRLTFTQEVLDFLDGKEE